MKVEGEEFKNSEQIEQAFDMISDAYYRISLIDLNHNYIRNLKLEEETNNNCIGHDFQRAVAYCAENYVEEGCKKIFFQVLSSENLKDMLSEGLKNPILTYRRKIKGKYKWVRAEIIPAKDYSEENAKILWCVKNIEEEKIRETEFKEKIIKLNVNLKETLRREAEFREEASRANLAKSDFLARMSHDIRIPLNTITGFCTVASAHEDDLEWMKERMDKIRVASKHLISLVDEILELRTMEAGKVLIQKESFSLTELVIETTRMMSEAAKQKNQRLSVKMYDLEHDYVIGDSLRMRQIFMNLVSNAIKYTPSGGEIQVVITEQKKHVFLLDGIQTEKEAKPNTGYYECKVIDNGIGIRAEFIENIFKPFTRVQERTKEYVEGTGLGLSIVKEIVGLMGGDIQVNSDYGKGSIFAATVLLEQQSDQSNKSNAVIEINEIHHQKNEYSMQDVYMRDYTGKRVLLVEDNQLNRELEAEILRMTGLEVDEVENGEKAYESVNSMPPNYYDIVFMDICMPVMDGCDATCAIRKIGREDLKQLPIVAMSANVFSDDFQKSESAGMNAHISKPLDIKQLLKILDRFIKDACDEQVVTYEK